MASVTPVRVAFASCEPERAGAFVEAFSHIAPELELFVVSELPPPAGRWIRYRPDRSRKDNLNRIRAALAGREIRFGAVMLGAVEPWTVLQRMGIGLAGPLRTLFYNQNLDHYMLRRPTGWKAAARHVYWRARERVVFQCRPGGDVYTWLWRLRHPSQLPGPTRFRFARSSAVWGGKRGAALRRARPVVKQAAPKAELPDGISVVIPSRNGLGLLKTLLPLISGVDEVIVVDNGSDDGSAEWLRSQAARVVESREPLSFARAVNRGITEARYSHVCLLNNDMRVEPDFFRALRAAFDSTPDLFCATAQIFFPEGRRREETGKAVMRPPVTVRRSTEFPVYCAEPLAGEDGSWVLYGSGGCSLYDTAKLRALGGMDEGYEPAYVEDLDLGVRGWQRGWPTVFVSGARTIHDHRTTTSRYYTEEQLAVVLERNYLRFVAGTVQSPELFARLWRDATERLVLKVIEEKDKAAEIVIQEAGAFAARGPAHPRVCEPLDEELAFALGSGSVAVFPGRAAQHDSTVLVASCYTPFPLAHGGAVRMYNLMRRASRDVSQVLITFVDELQTPPPELLDICVAVVQVRRVGAHIRHKDTGQPDAVDDFDSAPFRAALRESIRKWKPGIVQLEFTQMAQYARDCAGARTMLVEHDVTIDLYQQLLSKTPDDYDLRQQLERWVRFEKQAWRDVDCVITMSARDERSIEGARMVQTLRNGVDLTRFEACADPPERGRVLFIGSFNHLPNLLALDFFLRDVWPKLADLQPTLHVIAGSNHRFFYERWRDRLGFTLDHPGMELEDFVSDVRPAYRRASAVIAPLLASAGTNIKIMEAMAMGKAIVSTPGGVNGLDELRPGHDVLVESDPDAFARSLRSVLTDAAYRDQLGRQARETVEREFDWDTIARRQLEIYRLLRS